ncbi:class II aldolase/adducin family protein [Roseomonas gilardii]|uniref:class II aldolase/adducin family protein n=1 Tax=Roseomonas gilardii TaxID=257708 RepID=UPI0004B079CE|nr:class II aldolase/adducin family protein [Roseomonas gilardii]
MTLEATAPKTRAGSADSAIVADLRRDIALANRILYKKGVVDAFGHVSARHPELSDHFLLARNMAPARVDAGDVLTFDAEGNPVLADGPPVYLERFIHAALYRARPDVMAIVHSHSPTIVPLSTVKGMTLRCICHMGGFIGSGAPIFEIRDTAGPGTNLLITDNALGDALVRSLGGAAVVLMRGHGSTVVGADVRQAVYRAIYAEVSAKMQVEALRLGPVTYLTPEEATSAAAASDSQIARAWDLWVSEVNLPSEDAP